LERTESGLAPWPSAIPLEVLVGDVIEALRRIGPVTVSVLPDREENIEFRLPAELAAG
jgi:4-hydroxy-3-methylbut-2-en-1-yl diphosphate reductase